MMASANPYSSDMHIEQDWQFFDQDEAIKEIVRCLRKDKSCAIIGGAGMGKTSVLRHVQRMFSSTVQPTDSRFIPVYFTPEWGKISSARSIYQQLINVTIHQTQNWLASYMPDDADARKALNALNLKSSRMMTNVSKYGGDETYTDFENDLYTIIHSISVMSDVRLLVLLDHIYCIKDKGCQNTLVERWLQLLDSDLQSYLAFIITCPRDFFDQFDLRRSDASMGPARGYHSIGPIYLYVFEQIYSCQFVRSCLKDIPNLELVDEVVNEIHDLTGGHPFLLQSAVDDLKIDAKMGKLIDTARVQNLRPAWSKNCREIYRWIQDMVMQKDQALSLVVLSLLLAQDTTWEYASLAKTLREHPLGSQQSCYLQDVLDTLTSWGVVRKVGGNAYRVSGKLFRDWLEWLPVTRVDETVQVQKKEEQTMTAPYTTALVMAVIDKTVGFLFGQATDMLKEWREKRRVSGETSTSEPLQVEDESSIRDPQTLRTIVEEKITILEQQSYDTAHRIRVKEIESLMKQIQNLHQNKLRFEEESTNLPSLDDRIAIQKRIEDTDDEIAQRADKMRRILEQLSQSKILIPVLDE
jgi:hypothetical protein